MIIVMERYATKEQIKKVIKRIRELGYKEHVIHGVERTVVGCVGREDKRPLQALETMPGVESVVPILKPYKLASREIKKEKSIIKVEDIQIGGDEIIIMAGPCSVESESQIIRIAKEVKKAGAKVLRGGAYKPRTSPYAFQGLEKKGLKILAKAKKETGLKIVTEVITPTDVPLVCEYADILQIGARNTQNYVLLKAVGKTKKPVLLKRGMSTTIQEFLMSAEYILSQGNYNVMLCERGIRTFETMTRFTLDLNAIPMIRHLSHLPTIVDPSHGTGYWRIVEPMSMAAIAAGADGLLIEVHYEPDIAFSDGPQSLKPDKFAHLVENVRKIAEAVGRKL